MPKGPTEPKKPLTLRPLKLEDGLRAAMETGPPPDLPSKKKSAKKAADFNK